MAKPLFKIENQFKQIQFEPKPEPELPIVPATGGAILKTGEFRSPNYERGLAGWKIDADGNAEFQSITIPNIPDVQTFTSSGTWIKPVGAKFVQVICIGAGGGGCSGHKVDAVQGGGGTGGGGGAVVIGFFLAELLGETETVTVGATAVGGAPVTAVTTKGNAGADGGTSSFGTWAVATGGKGAPQNRLDGTSVPGGNGGAIMAARALANATGGVGGLSAADTVGAASEHGGASGAGNFAGNGLKGGSSALAGAGGGSGGRTDSKGEAGGTVGTYDAGGGGVGGTVGGGVNDPGGAGSNGDSNSTIKIGFGGEGGGAGAGGRGSGNGGDGGNGGIPGGAGGGGGQTKTGTQSGKGGDGARGEIRVYTW